jgi:hypothetical protein
MKCAYVLVSVRIEATASTLTSLGVATLEGHLQNSTKYTLNSHKIRIYIPETYITELCGIISY